MPSSYKTPGVFVEEVSKFPPSVAPVETAIPAFIGYTEKAEKNGEPIEFKPTKIGSFVEYEQFFGGAPNRDLIIRLNTSSQFHKIERRNNAKTYYLYDSLRMFYDNGGGDCYIVSVGDYLSSVAIGSASNPQEGILGGLKALEKYDEPTIIVSPDATLLGDNMYSYQQQALAQCNKLQDRVLVGDLHKANASDFDDTVTDFRDKIGINNLKYGAVYAPWLRSSISAGLQFRDVWFAKDGDTPSQENSRAVLFGLTSDDGIRQLIFDLENTIKAASGLEEKIDPSDPANNILDGKSDLLGAFKALADEYEKAISSFDENATPTPSDWPAMDTPLTDLYAKFLEVTSIIHGLKNDLPNLVTEINNPSIGQTINFKLKRDIDNLLPAIKTIFEQLRTHHHEIDRASSNAISLFDVASSNFIDTYNLLGYANPVDLNNVPKNPSAQHEYFMALAFEAVNAQLNTTADNTPNTTPAAALAHIMDANNVPDDLAGTINAFIAAAPTDAPADVIGHITGIAPANPAETFARAVGLAYATPQGAANSGITVVADLSSSFNDQIANARATATTIAASASTAQEVSDAIRSPAEPKKRQAELAGEGGKAAISSFVGLFNDTLEAAGAYENTFDSSLKDVFGVYKSLLNRADQEVMVLPPSAAIAGIYAFVDANRGVWKAPANVSLSSVIEPLVPINANDQADLNVDVNAGKSINAIRSFTGKGILVWGARTLAGNDNEWRYVPVRRFFNFAEESIKKATEQFVFEPNDANTWVKVKAMIENFLVLQWRAGALAGAKPAQAFFVKVGLGETMTSLDILEGRMIVEIGMAVVRPAEFIILRFSHKMQEA